MRLPRKRTLGLLVGAALVAAGFAVWFLLPDYRNAVQEQRSLSGKVVIDRNGRILRIFPDNRDRYALWKNLSVFPDSLKKAVIAAEDKRFLSHPGFDPVAIVRALLTNVERGRVVSGASTITEQVVRLIHPRPRTYSSKIIELVAAMKMEAQLSKDQILELFLNLSPMGSGVRGAGLAARVYFGKDVSKISLPESAVLAALPRSPTRYSPRTASGRKQLKAEEDRILARMALLGFIDSGQLHRCLHAAVKFRNKNFPMEAPHLVDLVITPPILRTGVIKATLDLNLQHSLERVIRSHATRLHSLGVDQMGALIVSVKDGKVLALMGSFRYGHEGQGYNNAVLAQRGAGSTLKPFLYAVALENGYQAFSEIPDTFRSYSTPHGDYLPFNADRRTYGPVTIRTALGNSLNVSAVKMARSLGIGEFYRLLGRLDLVSKESFPADHYGLGIAVGNVEISLYKLVQAYTALASGGLFTPLSTVDGVKSRPTRVLSPETAYIITDVLCDPTARLLTFGNPSYFNFGFPVAVKTGTSSNFRDAWIVAYTSRHVIGIWAGNFNGRPTNGAGGATVCGPVLKDVVELLYGGVAPAPMPRPQGVRHVRICSVSEKRAGPSCPQTVTELTTASSEIEMCRVAHDTQYRYLGGPYARWIHRREARLGPGRFRLEAARDGSSGPGGDPMEPVAGSSHLQAGFEAGRVAIVSPHNLDRFVLNRHGANKILLRAVPQPVVSEILWLVDGVELAKTPPPYEVFWDPTPGSHVIHAVTPGHLASTVTIYVE